MKNHLSVYVPKEYSAERLVERLAALAEGTGRSRNSHAVRALLEYVTTHSQLSSEVEAALERVESRIPTHLELFRSAWTAYHGHIYEMDLLITAVLNRSLSNVRGFCRLLRQLNFLCAAIVLRSQIDNLLRLSAAWLVQDPKEFVLKVLEGTPIRKLADRGGKKMTDVFLCKTLSRVHPWIERVYREASGYVHLSEKHILYTHRPTGQFEMETSLGEPDAFVTDTLRLEAIAAFDAATDLLFDYVKGWIFTKSHPDHPLVMEGKRKILEAHNRDSGAVP